MLASRYQAAVREAYDRLARDADLLPSVLAVACVEVLPVAGAGLSLTDVLRVPLGGSGPLVSQVEGLQATLGEGPCLSAMEDGEPLVADAATLEQRWPAFCRELSARSPFRSVASLPLALPGQRAFGALDLYRTEAEADTSLLEPDVRTEVVDQIVMLLQQAPMTSASWTAEPVAVWLGGPSVTRRMEVWAAVGMVMSTAGLDEVDALSVLRSYAYGHDLVLDEVAQLLVDHRLEAAVVVR